MKFNNTMKKEIFETVKEILVTSEGMAPESISLDSTFEELNMDSLSGLALIDELEEKYEIKISNEEVFSIKSINGAIIKIEELLNARK